jgi:hypothetical protein
MVDEMYIVLALFMLMKILEKPTQQELPHFYTFLF